MRGWSSVDDAREARQEGLTRFATIVGGWFGAFGLLPPLIAIGSSAATSRPRVLVIAFPVALVVTALLGRRRLAEPHATAVEAALMTLPVAQGATTIALWPVPIARGDLIVALAATMLSLLRALIVPSSPRRTAVFSALAFVPALVAAGIVGETMGDGKAGPIAINMVAEAVWALAVVAMSAYGSRTVYGPRATRHLGPYELDGELGSGGMGVVYRAQHRALRRAAAVKLLAASAHDAGALERFEREVMQTSRLSHPNTITVYDYGRTSDGSLYYAMELVDGVDLERLVRERGPQPAARVVHILTQVCASLAEAHELGLVHRDVKPANIMLCRRGGFADVVKVVDFGLVRDVTSGDDLTRSNMVLGTPEYCSPEMIDSSARVTASSDLYAVGCVAYQLLTGRPPFVADSMLDLLRQHVYVPPIPPNAMVELPEELERVVLSCLEKSPSARPQSARALAELLSACVPAWTDADAQAAWEPPGSDTHQAAPRETDTIRHVRVNAG